MDNAWLKISEKTRVRISSICRVSSTEHGIAVWVAGVDQALVMQDTKTLPVDAVDALLAEFAYTYNDRRPCEFSQVRLIQAAGGRWLWETDN
jgi:hypothetical protein